MNSISLAPLFVEKLLELLMRHEFFVSVKNGDVEVCVMMTSVGLCLQQSLNLVFRCTFVQHRDGEVLTFLSDIIEVFIEVLYLVGVLVGLQGVLQTLLHRVVLLHVLGLLESDGAVDGAGPRLEELDLLEVILVDPPGVVRHQSESRGV